MTLPKCARWKKNLFLVYFAGMLNNARLILSSFLEKNNFNIYPSYLSFYLSLKKQHISSSQWQLVCANMFNPRIISTSTNDHNLVLGISKRARYIYIY